MDEPRLTRRRLIVAGLVAPPLALVLARTGGAGLWSAETALAATPSCPDDGPTPEQTEGPYFSPGSPRRRNLRTAGVTGVPLSITGSVLTRRCRPVPRALIEVWQADAQGRYDNQGYRLRGHQLTDARGRYRIETVVPGRYPGRTRHIHVKVQAPGRPVLTTQLYFPGEPGNASDMIFDPALVMAVRRAGRTRIARFDFVLDA